MPGALKLSRTRPDRRWSAEQIDALRAFVGWAKTEVPGLEVYGHRDVPGGTTATECPGLDVRALLDRG